MTLPRIWVDDPVQLEQLCNLWQHQQELAMDTEFIRTDTFYPKPALLQVSDGQTCYLLDVLKLGKADALRRLLTSGPQKIFHSCSEDLEMLAHWLGVLPQPLIDTQLAAALVEQETGIGYQRLVERLLGIVLEKGETRSDWLQRPLTESQQKYAAQDVEFLLPAWHLLKEKLQQQGRLELLEEESQWLVTDADPVPEDAWLRCKQAWRLNSRQLAVLQQLALWREEKARQLNRPRNRVASDNLLQSLAERQPQHLAAFTGIEEAAPGWIKRYGQDILDCIERVAGWPDHALPAVLVSPMSQEYKTQRKALKKELDGLATSLQVPVELLARRRYVDEWTQALSLKQTPEVPEGWPDWRRVPLEALMQDLTEKKG